MSATAEVDRLFQLPLGAFTAARNALAAKLKKDGDSEESDRIRALSKPPVSAWVANQLYWKHRNAFDRMLAAGDEFRKAQAAQLAGKSADLRGSLDARREALGELTKVANEVLRDAGHPASPEMMRRIMTTLEALATYGDHADGPPLGRLTVDVDPPGFEALAALVPAAKHHGSGAAKGQSAPRVIPFNQPTPQRSTRKPADDREAAQERRERQNEARKALREAERSLTEARRTAERARADMKEAAARAKAAEKDKASLEARIEKLSAAAEAARQAARQVASRAEEAAQAVDDAERAVAAAREQLRATEN